MTMESSLLTSPVSDKVSTARNHFESLEAELQWVNQEIENLRTELCTKTSMNEPSEIPSPSDDCQEINQLKVHLSEVQQKYEEAEKAWVKREKRSFFDEKYIIMQECSHKKEQLKIDISKRAENNKEIIVASDLITEMIDLYNNLSKLEQKYKKREEQPNFDEIAQNLKKYANELKFLKKARNRSNNEKEKIELDHQIQELLPKYQRTEEKWKELRRNRINQLKGEISEDEFLAMIKYNYEMYKKKKIISEKLSRIEKKIAAHMAKRIELVEKKLLVLPELLALLKQELLLFSPLLSQVQEEKRELLQKKKEQEEQKTSFLQQIQELKEIELNIQQQDNERKLPKLKEELLKLDTEQHELTFWTSRQKIIQPDLIRKEEEWNSLKDYNPRPDQEKINRLIDENEQIKQIMLKYDSSPQSASQPVEKRKKKDTNNKKIENLQSQIKRLETILGNVPVDGLAVDATTAQRQIAALLEHGNFKTDAEKKTTENQLKQICEWRDKVIKFFIYRKKFPPHLPGNPVEAFRAESLNHYKHIDADTTRTIVATYLKNIQSKYGIEIKKEAILPIPCIPKIVTTDAYLQQEKNYKNYCMFNSYREKKRWAASEAQINVDLMPKRMSALESQISGLQKVINEDQGKLQVFKQNAQSMDSQSESQRVAEDTQFPNDVSKLQISGDTEQIQLKQQIEENQQKLKHMIKELINKIINWVEPTRVAWKQYATGKGILNYYDKLEKDIKEIINQYSLNIIKNLKEQISNLKEQYNKLNPQKEAISRNPVPPLPVNSQEFLKLKAEVSSNNQKIGTLEQKIVNKEAMKKQAQASFKSVSEESEKIAQIIALHREILKIKQENNEILEKLKLIRKEREEFNNEKAKIPCSEE